MCSPSSLWSFLCAKRTYSEQLILQFDLFILFRDGATAMNMIIQKPAKPIKPTHKSMMGWIPTVHTNAQRACCALCNISTHTNPPKQSEIKERYTNAVKSCQIAGMETFGPSSKGVSLHEMIFAAFQRACKTYGRTLPQWNETGIINTKDKNAINYANPAIISIRDDVMWKKGRGEKAVYKFKTKAALKQPVTKLPAPHCI